MIHNKEILHGEVNEVFLKYLAPSVFATIMISINFFVDALCIGQTLGEEGLAALNLAWPITTVFYSLGFLFGVGGGAMYSSYMARGEKKRAQGVYTAAVSVMVLLAVVITAVSLIFLEPLVTMLGATGEIRQGVTEYTRWVLIFSIAYMGDCFYTSFLRNDNAPKLAMTGTIIACVINVICDVLFVNILDGGMVGASLASAFAVTSTLILGVCSTFRKSSGLKLRFSQVKLGEIIKIVKVGMAAFLTEVDSGIVTFVYNSVIIRIVGAGATTAVAVYGIVVNVNTIVLGTINGFSNAMQPLVSANNGVGKEKRSAKFMKLAVKWGTGMAIIFVLLIEWKADLLVRIFLEPGENFLIQAQRAVRIVAISYLLAAANMILISYFQAIQASTQAAYSSFLRTLILPIIYVVFGAVFFGIDGVWIASIWIEGTTIIILLFVYYFYKKKQKVIGEERSG